MTISITGPRVSYTGNGSTTVFSFPRQFFLSTDLDVYLVNTSTGVSVTQILGTHYSVSGAGSPSGGSITMVTAPPVGQTLVIVRDTPLTQGLDLDNVTALPMTSLEAALDRAMMTIDEVNTKAVKGPMNTASAFDYSLPTPVAKQYLRTKSDVTGLEWAAGQSWLTGAGTPAGSLGLVDDLYLDTSTGAYYKKTASTTWTLQGNLSGPMGQSGSATAAKELDTVAALLADTTLTYTAGSNSSVVTGDYVKVRNGAHVYQVQASGSSTNHIATAGGVKLNVLPGLSGYSVMAFGAKGDGVTDDSAAIQKAFDTAKPTAVPSFPNNSGTFFFPKGTYIIGTAVNVWPALNLVGTGTASILKAGPSNTDAILNLAGAVNGQSRFNDISFLNFQGTGTVWGMKCTAGILEDLLVHDCTFSINYAINCNPPAESVNFTGLTGYTYTQSCRFINNTAFGPLDQFIRLFGNRNYIEDFNKEGTSGSSTDPYIYIYDSRQIYIHNTLVEGSGSVNKVPIKIVGGKWLDKANFQSGVRLSNLWNEVGASNGYAMDIDFANVSVEGNYNYISGTNNKIKISNSSTLWFENYDDSATTATLATTLECDSTSQFRIVEATSRTWANIYKLDLMKSQQRIDNSYIRGGSGVPANGYLLKNSVKWIGGNMLVNPSFEAGRYGWTIGGAPTVTIEQSEVSTGLQMRLLYGADTSTNCTQSFTIDAAQAGRPFTFCGMIKLVTSIAGTGWGSITASGCGMTTSGSDGFMSVVSAGAGWQFVSQTFTPITSGTLVVGFRILTASEVIFDNASFHYGTEGEPDRTRLGSIELNQKTVTTATAAPTTGTWKVGDRVFNSAPSGTAGTADYWVCTTAGSPGTWTVRNF